MLCMPAANALDVHIAVRLLPLPANATAEQPAIDVAPSLKLTVPVGFTPLTVAVKLTLAPTLEGFAELVSVFVLGTRLLEVSATLSMKVVLSLGSVPVKAIVCALVLATENE